MVNTPKLLLYSTHSTSTPDGLKNPAGAGPAIRQFSSSLLPNAHFKPHCHLLVPCTHSKSIQPKQNLNLQIHFIKIHSINIYWALMQCQELFYVLGMQQRIKETRFLLPWSLHWSDFLNIVFTPRNPEAKSSSQGLKKGTRKCSVPPPSVAQSSVEAIRLREKH